ncbi:MYND-type domain-containing protein [Favolaschia claudopus]|uniref:MYND-type domain-containing protein n=1 Tax=Favolaschia claudopus TaxID=2862362 RepID=A0AAW0C6J9_9AGAR
MYPLNRMVTIFCVVGDCNNSKNLKTCKRCKWEPFCSKCQKKDWKNHKAACNSNFEVLNGNESVFQRNLRAIVIGLEPRPHTNKGSRWREIYLLLEKLDALEGYRDGLLNHNKVKEHLRESSGGESDYTAVITLTSNSGRDALEGDHPSVHRDMVNSLPEKHFAVDSLEALLFELEEDHPMSSTVVLMFVYTPNLDPQ